MSSLARRRRAGSAPHKLGGHSVRETPLPIPNREVKPDSADGTRGASPRESRTPPIIFQRYAIGARRRASLCCANTRKCNFRITVLVAAMRALELRSGYGRGRVGSHPVSRRRSRHSGSRARSRATRSPDGGCVSNITARPSRANGEAT